MAHVNQILAPKKCKHASRDALGRCYGIYEISKTVSLFERSAIFSKISPQNNIFTKLQKHSFHGQMAHFSQILAQKCASMYLEMHLTDAMKYMKFQKQFYYLADGPFLVRFFPKNNIWPSG